MWSGGFVSMCETCQISTHAYPENIQALVWYSMVLIVPLSDTQNILVLLVIKFMLPSLLDESEFCTLATLMTPQKS